MSEFHRFETGAVRSSDANSVAYHLISPIGLERVANIYAKLEFLSTDLYECLEFALESTYFFLSGDRSNDYLAIAALHLFEACAIEEASDKENEYCRVLFEKLGYVNIAPAGIRRLAQTYKEGELKYGDFNWERGFQIHDLLNHGIRHIFLYLEGDKSEDHLAHASWAYIASMHSEELWPHLNEGYLRGPNCSLTEAILKRLDNKKS